MKNILILIHDMKIGGAQKSLLSFLDSLASSEYRDRYSVDLMVTCPSGPFMERLPSNVRLIPAPTALRYLSSRFSPALYLSDFSLRPFLRELWWIFRRKLGLLPENLNLQQCLWECWKDGVAQQEKKYDAAVSYIDGVTNYYLMDKVTADKKSLWVHNEYQKHGYDPEYDRAYYEKCDNIITISRRCRDCLEEAFPQQRGKMHILENISSGADIIAKSEAGTAPEFEAVSKIRLLSVGRLSYPKGFDIALEAACLLRAAGLDFLWLIVGEGGERQALTEQLESSGLADCVKLVGERDNPYVYMKACDILVQPSRTEGRSIVLDEAKILCKPIVSTAYTTVRDSLEHGKTGWITQLSPEGLAEGILLLCKDKKLRDGISANLKAAPKGNEEELEKYINIMF